MSARFIVGNTLDVLRSMPDASVDLVLSSPPFLALRSYLPADHPDKAKEIGSEPTPAAFIDTLLDVVEECRRVLAPHGSLCFELGDTYAGSGGAGGDYNEGGLRNGQNSFDGSANRQRGSDDPDERRDEQQADVGTGRSNARFRAGYLKNDGRKTAQVANYEVGYPPPARAKHGWPLDKSLCLIPELLRVAMVYGFNPLTGRATPRWRARNVVRWCRPNPPVGALGDKVRPATSDIIVACVGRKRYFDLDAVRGPGSTNTHARTAKGVESRPSSGKTADDAKRGGNFSTLATIHDTNGAPPLDHWWHDEDTFDQDAWNIPTEPYRGSHYATWPTDLLVRPILAMCPQRVCTTCGKPSERIVETHGTGQNTRTSRGMANDPRQKGAVVSSIVPEVADRTTLGWTDCGHDTWRNGVVLDPFGGSGTTAVVALGHGRDAVLIELDERNVELARERVGMWLEVERYAAETVA